MFVIGLFCGAIIGVFTIALIRAGDCGDCALRYYKDEEEGENK